MLCTVGVVYYTVILSQQLQLLPAKSILAPFLILIQQLPTYLSHSHTLNAPPIISPIPISPLCLTSHFMCVQLFHMVSIDVPAGVGAPPLNTTAVTTAVVAW